MAFVGGYAIADSHVGESLAESEMCLECHESDGISFRGEGADNIVNGINSIRAGDTEHIPSLENLSDEEITEIARILDRGAL